ncbi:MAG: hypothetical protein CL878_11540 [Dehalococcoidia bacterium]|nr:hypothetical protein [Dehalococcoidia bacterium]
MLRHFWRSGRFVVFAGLLALFPATAFAQGGPTISVTTEPGADKIIPDADLATTILEVKDAQGQLIKNAVIEFQLDAPSPSPWISTDFPIVAGTLLHQSRFDAPDGRLELKFVWPIRGDYSLLVRASPAPGTGASFAPITRELTVHLNENPAEGTNLLQFVLALGVLGLVAGMVMGAANRAGQPA